ncbi:MAG: hypothetical protein JNN04_12070 [Cyclobacteriaceae bacterium]|nr:hypothetical protein [Cyclobacteriaceae bacterium]
MRNISVLLLLAASASAFAQKADIVTVSTVKPKNGQRMAWEAAYKTHIAKFHGTTDKTNVYEIMSGPSTGYYHLVGPAGTFADFDTQRSDETAHNLDLDKTFFPMLGDSYEGVYQTIDSCGIRPGTPADAFVVSVRHLKEGLNMQDYRRELARASKIRTAQKSAFWTNFSTSYYEQQWDGSDQVTITVRALKDGFKSLANGFYPAEPTATPSFRDDYVRLYGHAAWDARVKLMDEAVVKTTQYIMKLRRDLSSK